MLDKGELRGHYLRREKRVYLESIAAYQTAHEIKVKVVAPAAGARRKARPVETDAARQLREFGL